MAYYTEFYKDWPAGWDFDILQRNSPGYEGFRESFMGYLHEEERWVEDAYFRLESALVSVGERYRDEDMPRGLTVWLYDQQHYIFGSLCYHRMDSDGFEIDGMSADESYDWAERVSYVFRAVIAGYDPRVAQFEPPNPLISSKGF
ncbi:MAG: Imm41 family immunity protein [Paracoccaceae bacterium]|nr:Imm41 family immunity protein [Paracoccaceae bacterium]